MPTHDIRRWAKDAATRRRATVSSAVVQRRRTKHSVARLKLNPTVAKLVDRRINRDNESHSNGYWWRRIQWTNRISDDPANRIVTIIPDVATGDTRDKRLGSQIKLTQLYIKGKIDIPPTDNPIVGNGDRALIYVRLMVLSCKKFRQIQEVRANWNTGQNLNDQFFKTGDAGQAPSGSYIDMLRHINSDAFTTHYDRVFKMDRNYNYFLDPTSTSGVATQRPDSRDFHIRLKVKNKVLKYEDHTVVQPDNYQPFVCYMYAFGNGAAPSSLAAVPFIEYQTTMSFKPN